MGPDGTKAVGRRANSLFMLGGQLVSKGATFGAMMLISRHLDDIWFGRLLFSLVLSFFSFFITDFGTAILVNRDMSLASMQNARELWRSALGFRTVTGLFALSSITLFSVMNYPAAQTFLLVPVLLGVTLEIYSELPFSYFRASGRTSYEALARIGSSAVFVAAVAGAILLDAPPMALAYSFLLRGMMMAVLSFSAARASGFGMRPSFKREHLLKLLGQAWPLGILGFLTVLHQRVDNLVIESHLGVVSVGAYNEIFKVVEVLILVVTPTLLPGALFPNLCRAFGNGPAGARYEMRRIALIVSTLSAVAVALVLPSGQIFMRFLWGEAFLRGVSPAAFETTRMLLFAAVPVYFFMNFLLAAMIAGGMQRCTLPAVFSGFTISLVLNLALVGRIGLPAAGVAALVSNVVIALICWVFLWKATGPGLLLPFVLGVLPIPAVILLMGRHPWPVVTVAGLAFSVPALLLMRKSLRGEELCQS